jgi:DNA-binding CsgD family transcriptional regulator
MDGPAGLEHARELYRARAWGDAFAQLSAAAEHTPLHVDDLERLAVSAYLLGRDAACTDAWIRAHEDCLHRGDTARAVRCAFWLGMKLMLSGETARGGGWIARAQRLVDDGGLRNCVERGFLLLPAALQQMDQGDLAGALATFERMTRIAGEFADRDLAAFGLLGRGQALIRLGRVEDGVALLDEVMVAVTAGEVSPVVSGVVYCAVILACQSIFDLRRAQEWTAALNAWSETEPDLVPFRGQCLVHRSEILQLHGAWSDAMDEVRRAHDRLSDPPGQPAVGMACYQQAELHRLQGEFAAAEEAYRQAHVWGHQPQPGLALLRLAQGRADAAAAAIRQVVDEARNRVNGASVLAAYVEIMLATDDLQAARDAADRMTAVAAELRAPLLAASSGHATGSVLLAEGDPHAAADVLRDAWIAWRDIGAPYEAARTRALLGLAHRMLGDEDTAVMELEAALAVFQRLSAAPDAARVERLLHPSAFRSEHGLTRREVEVLALVATGRTNRAIAADLFLSEKTVARHVSNILTKLGLSSRSAATAYAYEHDLVG